MNLPTERKRSRYMEWAKTCSAARFNLATSGLTSVSLTEFPLRVEELEITGGGYGYGPLLERIARHTGAPAECIVTAEGTSLANHLAMAALLEPGEDASDEKSLDAVGLDEDEGAFVHESSWESVGWSGSAGSASVSEGSGEPSASGEDSDEASDAGDRSSDLRSRPMAATAAA